MQAAMGLVDVRADSGMGNRGERRGKCGQNENRASIAKKFDSDSLSLHVFSIRCILSRLSG